MERALSIRLPKRFLWPHVLVDFQAKWFRTVDFQFRISYRIQFTAVAQRIQSQAIQRKNRCVHGQMTLTICKCEWLTFSNGMAKRKKNSISIATFSWWHENRLCWAHDAWRSTTTWNENINRMYASDNWNEEKRQPRSIALLYGNAHFDVFVPPIINGANIHSEPINMPTYRSLLFAPFHVWLFHAIGHFFLLCFIHIVFCNQWILSFFSRTTVALFSRHLNFIYIATWAE